MRLQAAVLVVFALAVLSGCTGDRRYAVSAERAGAPAPAGAKGAAPALAAHDLAVEATLEAIQEEGYGRAERVTRKDKDLEGGGKFTKIESDYTHYSKVRAEITTHPEQHHGKPKVEVHVRTRDALFTRHQQWEDRILALVELKVRGKAYGPETQPTALPPAPIPEPKAFPDRAKNEPKPAAAPKAE